MADYWLEAMQWLRIATPEPFGSADHYGARYDGSGPPAAYTIMNWWDQGYWIIHSARRVPVSNPTQGGAPVAARFLTTTEESEALTILASQRARYVIVDFELPFRNASSNALAGRFQNLADWAGIPTSRYYQLCFSRAGETESWQPTWIFREAYYQSMAYRLMVLGGAAVSPENNTYVVELRDRTDVNGRQFCEVASRTQYATADQARAAAQQRGRGFHAVGLTPWFAAFPVSAVTGLRQVADFREPAQRPAEPPMLRIFEVVSH
jgi:asparagine N-glycosylation enzyme membrane subunit Stt3